MDLCSNRTLTLAALGRPFSLGMLYDCRNDYLIPGSMLAHYSVSQSVSQSEVFSQGIATHVVTGILYGANAFFVFDREVSSGEDRQDIEGNLKVMFNSIPIIYIEGESALDMKNSSKTKTEKISCGFHGDVILENNPITFEDAMDTYKTLPQKVGEGVPVQHYKSRNYYSKTLVNYNITALEDLSELEMRCNDAMRSKPIKYFKEIDAKVKTFKKLCSTEHLKTTLAALLPSIRGGEKEERVLSDFLKKQQEFRFNSNILSECMDRIEREINVVDRFLSMITEDYSQTCSIKIVTSKSELDKEVLNPKVKRVVCFTFTSLGCEDPVLSALDSPSSESTQALVTVKPDLTRWYRSANIIHDMDKQAGLFKDFAEANKENTETRFLLASIPNKEQEGASIYLYENGSIRNEHLEPPSKPETPTARDRTHNCVTLELLPPDRGAHDVTHYLIEYCIELKGGWSSEKTSESHAAYTVSGLHEAYWPFISFSFFLLVHCSPVFLFSCSPVLLFSCSPVLLFSCSAVLLFSCSAVLLFSCSPSCFGMSTFGVQPGVVCLRDVPFWSPARCCLSQRCSLLESSQVLSVSEMFPSGVQPGVVCLRDVPVWSPARCCLSQRCSRLESSQVLSVSEMFPSLHCRTISIIFMYSGENKYLIHCRFCRFSYLQSR
uniref:Uncharacterized protein n=1 Tax=Salmo trutta TaxID=8032 RepID=A0A674AX80_SALTR